jgi:hypothetical protein
MRDDGLAVYAPMSAARAVGALRTWESRYNFVFTHPTKAQVEEFAELVGAASSDRPLAERLRSLVPSLELRARGG